jgi:hypothetical protein
MVKKRKSASIIAMALCAAMSMGGCSAIISLQVSNAFDEMYLSIKYPRESDTWFGYMDPIGESLFENIDSTGYYFNTYAHSLRDGEEIYVAVDIRDETIGLLGSFEVSDTRNVTFVYRYHFRSKILYIEPVLLMMRDNLEMGVEFDIDDGGQLAAYFEEHGVTRDDVGRCRDYFLYDKVLTDWVTGNGARSRFSPGDFGDFDVIDDTFANLGEDWR